MARELGLGDKHRPTYCTRVFRYFAIKDEDGSVRAGHINSRLIDGFREISLRTELSTRIICPSSRLSARAYRILSLPTARILG